MPVSAEQGSSRIDPALRMLIDDNDRVAGLQEQSARDALPFEAELAADGTVVIAVFVDTTSPTTTADAIRAGGGSVSLVMEQRLIARLPVSLVRSIAARQEVARIEPSWKRRS